MTPGERTRIGDADVHWRREGSGPAVVFLHGFPLSGLTWEKVVAALCDRFTCILPDLVGLGGSESASSGDYSSPGQAAVFSALLRHLGVASYALVGNDTGGWIARELALLDGARVTRLALTNTEIPFHRPPWIPIYQVLAQIPGTGAAFRAFLSSAAFRRSPLGFGGCFHDVSRIEGEFHVRYVEPLLRSPARMAHALRFLREMKFRRLDEFARLHGSLALPTLFVWGADDPTFPVVRARGMIRQFPNAAGFHELPDAKLFVYDDRPAEVAALLASFLAS